MLSIYNGEVIVHGIPVFVNETRLVLLSMENTGTIGIVLHEYFDTATDNILVNCADCTQYRDWNQPVIDADTGVALLHDNLS